MAKGILKAVKTERPKTPAAVVNGETFRQQMYDEYVHKVLEREERKHHKVVKISTHEDIRKPSNSLEKNGMSAVEKEFIEKARNRLNKFGINLDESEPECDSKGDKVRDRGEKEQDGGEDVVTAKCLIDGKAFEDAGKLPQHLQEFLKISATTSPDDGESHPNREDLLCYSSFFRLLPLNLPSARVFRLIFGFVRSLQCRELHITVTNARS